MPSGYQKCTGLSAKEIIKPLLYIGVVKDYIQIYYFQESIKAWRFTWGEQWNWGVYYIINSKKVLFKEHQQNSQLFFNQTYQ